MNHLSIRPGIRPTSETSMAGCGRCGGDSGAAIVELAIALPLLATLVTGVLEYGWAYRESNLLERALNTAGRVVSQQSTGRFADFEALRAIDSGAGALRNSTVERVIIWKANSANTPPSGCIPPTLNPSPSGTASGGYGVAGSCNYYTPAQIDTVNPTGFTSSGANCAGSAWDQRWCPTGRSQNIPDSVGVTVDIRYTTLTKITGSSTISMRRTAIFRLEPTSVTG